ncbi:hypothetical protein GW17_00012317 [Ensete ventricosum]|nr:hypothetical protein GW17_00012317 [Ensete ventricosum]
MGEKSPVSEGCDGARTTHGQQRCTGEDGTGKGGDITSYHPVAGGLRTGNLADWYIPPDPPSTGRTTPHLPTGERGGASFSREETRRHLVIPLEDEAAPRPRGRRRGDASFSRGKTRRRLVLSREDEAAPCPPARRQGDASSQHGKMRRHLVLPLEDKSSPRCLVPAWGDVQYRPVAGDHILTRRRLVLPGEDEVSPHSPAARRGGASFSREKTRRRLVLSREDEAAPCPPARRQGGASSQRGKMRRHLVLPLEDIASLPRYRMGRRIVPPNSGRSHTSTYRPYRVVQIETENLA